MRDHLFRPFGVFFIALAFLLSACDTSELEPGPQTVFDPEDQRQRDRFGTITGGDGITIFNTNPTGNGVAGGGGGGIGVNAFLWRGSLDTIDFLPLRSADPFGGLIITDWFQPAITPGERVKLHVLITDTTLRADGVRVSVFRQINDPALGWLDAPVDPSTGRQLEDRILTKARELRIAQVESAQ